MILFVVNRWDSGTNVGEFDGHSRRVLSCAFKPTRPFRIVTCGEDYLVNFYEGPPFKFKLSLRFVSAPLDKSDCLVDMFVRMHFKYFSWIFSKMIISRSCYLYSAHLLIILLFSFPGVVFLWRWWCTQRRWIDFSCYVTFWEVVRFLWFQTLFFIGNRPKNAV